MQSPVPQFTRMLHALAAILAKAEAHAAARKIAPEALLQARLFPDMMTLVGQVQLACDFAARASARLAGADIRNFPDTETSFAVLQARIATALAYIAAFSADAYGGAEARAVTIRQQGRDTTMTGSEYLSLFAQPQFFFHVTAAYCILRAKGIEIGKGDYMGA